MNKLSYLEQKVEDLEDRIRTLEDKLTIFINEMHEVNSWIGDEEDRKRYKQEIA